MKLTKPEAIIFYLDDTLILSEGTIRKTWEEVCKNYLDQNPAVASEMLFKTIHDISIWFWSDKTRHCKGRNDMDNA